MPREAFHERSIGESERLNRSAKEAIAAPVTESVLAGSTIFLDAGTTCLAVARRLAHRAPMTVVTRGLEAGLLLTRAEGISVVVLGGKMRALSHGTAGPLAALALERLAFDVAFLGADAVDPAPGLGEPSPDDTYVKELAASRATEVVLIVDASKLGPAQLPAWLPFGTDWRVVTDAGAGEEMVSDSPGAGFRSRSPDPARGLLRRHDTSSSR